MTYSEYKKDTLLNCMTVLSECSYNELFELEHVKRLLWEDDRVTGVFSGHCTSSNEDIIRQIDSVLFDQSFICDAIECDLSLWITMNSSPDMIDVTIRCVCLLQFNIFELVSWEIQRRNHIYSEH